MCVCMLGFGLGRAIKFMGRKKRTKNQRQPNQMRASRTKKRVSMCLSWGAETKWKLKMKFLLRASWLRNNFIAYFSAVFIFITLGTFHCYASVVCQHTERTTHKPPTVDNVLEDVRPPRTTLKTQTQPPPPTVSLLAVFVLA